MLSEWSDREPDPGDRPWTRRIVAAIVGLATLAMLAQLALCAAAGM